MSAGGIRATLWCILFSLVVIFIIVTTMGMAQAQGVVPCWSVPNGSNSTIQCANGYWQTITPQGDVYSGNGMDDPSAGAQGSSIVINPGTGGPNTGAGPSVTAPTQQLPLLAPHQAETFGFQPRQD